MDFLITDILAGLIIGWAYFKALYSIIKQDKHGHSCKDGKCSY